MLVNILLGIATISTFFSYLPQTIKKYLEIKLLVTLVFLHGYYG